MNVRWITLTCAAALLLPAVAHSAARPLPDATDPAVAHLMRVYRITRAEAQHRVDLQPAIAALNARASALYPEEFAGVWVDHHAGGSVFVAFTPGTRAAIERLQAEDTLRSRIRPVTHRRSLRELGALLDRMIEDRTSLRNGGLRIGGSIGDYALKIDEAANRIVVLTPSPTTTFKAEIRRRYGADIVVEPGSLPVPTSCGFYDCRFSAMSGLAIYAEDGARCSTAFSADGGTRIFTAGHCTLGHLGTWTHADIAIGSTESGQQLGAVDAGVLLTSGNFHLGAWILTGTNSVVAVQSAQTYAQTFVGQAICKTGSTTGVTCGTVVSKTFSDGNAVNFIESDMCVNSGDSGAGVYSGSAAVGIVSAKGCRGEGCSTDCDGPTFFSLSGHIQFAQAALGKTVSTVEVGPQFTAVTDVRSNVAEFTALFNKPIVCESVGAADFRVRSSLLGLNAVDHNVTGVTCNQDSNRSIRLRISPAPVLLTALDVSLTGSVIDRGGVSAPPATRSAPVAL